MDILKNKKEVKKESAFEEEVWDKKKVLGFIIVVAALAIGGYKAKSLLLGQNATFSPKQVVEGISTSNSNINQSIPSPTPINFQEKVAAIQKAASSLNVADVASSSPQVQKILEQVKGLGDLPKEEAKQICQKICSGL